MPTKKKSTIENTDAIEEKKKEVKKEAVAEKAAVKPAAKKAAAQPRAKKQAKPEAPAADAVSEPKAETKKEEVVPVTDIRVVPKKKILFVASESTPFIATGGLAEVIGSLSKALAQNALGQSHPPAAHPSVLAPLACVLLGQFQNDFHS